MYAIRSYYAHCTDTTCNCCNHIRSTSGHTYSTPSTPTDGTDATCNNCSYDRLSVNVTTPSSTGTYYTGQTVSLGGTASINCYRMVASVTRSGGSEVWLSEQYNTSSYSNSYTFTNIGTYTIKIGARDLNT